MEYRDEELFFPDALWIGGGDAFLESLEQKRAIGGTMWIWPDHYARVHLRKSFSIEKAVSAHAAFMCDNPFTVFINEVCLAQNVRAFDGGVTLKAGENTVFITSCQTDSDEWFSSALCGLIEGEGFHVGTDATWRSYLTKNFWENGEDENWQNNISRPVRTVACALHPRAIKRSLYLRKTFFCPRPVVRATLLASEEGETELYLNGRRTDEEFLPQGACRDVREAREFDVTALVQSGKNAIGVLTGNGWLNSESHSQVFMNKNLVLIRLTLTFDDGTEQIVATDETWKCAPSPLYENDLQYGERYDARCEIPGWCEADFDDSAWENAVVQTPLCARVIRRVAPPIRTMRTLAPVNVFTRGGAVFYDFGETVAGAFRLRLKDTQPGQKIKVSCCERLDRTGAPVVTLYASVFFDHDSLPGGVAPGSLKNANVYFCKGAKEEMYEPRFTFNGFRYLYITGLTEPAQAELVACVRHNALTRTASLQSDCRFLRRLLRATERTMEGNCFHGFLDCPTREKNFWTGDTQVFAPTACFLCDCSSLLARWTDHGRKMCSNVFGWGDEAYLVPWILYRFYGDRGILRARYPAILEMARERCENLKGYLPAKIVSPFNDHASVAPKLPPEFFAHAYFCYMLKIVVQIAETLGDFASAQLYAKKLENARHAFRKRYFLPLENDFTPRTQSALVLPLAFDIVPSHRRAAVARKLRDRVFSDGHITTGMAGTRYILNVLCENGFTDAAYFLLDHESYPSWKRMIRGSSTLTETWHGVSGKTHPSGSMNHFMFGTVTGWMFECLAGIRPRESEPGFTHLVLAPSILPQIGSFKAEFHSVSGPIRVRWNVSGNTVTYAFSTAQSVTLIRPDGVTLSFPAGSHKVSWRIGNE